MPLVATAEHLLRAHRSHSNCLTLFLSQYHSIYIQAADCYSHWLALSKTGPTKCPVWNSLLLRIDAQACHSSFSKLICYDEYLLILCIFCIFLIIWIIGSRRSESAAHKVPITERKITLILVEPFLGFFLRPLLTSAYISRWGKQTSHRRPQRVMWALWTFLLHVPFSLSSPLSVLLYKKQQQHSKNTCTCTAYYVSLDTVIIYSTSCQSPPPSVLGTACECVVRRTLVPLSSFKFSYVFMYRMCRSR